MRLGSSGLRVSRIALGAMSFGDPARGFSQWSLTEEEAGPFLAQAVELGITFWDTANVYGYGSSEEIVGPTKPHHLADAVAALAVQLTDAEVHALEEHYRPHLPTAF